MTREGGVTAPSTRLQHLGNSKVLLEQKRQSDTPGLPGPRRRVRNGYPRELVCPRYRLPEPEGGRVLGDLLRATSRGDKQPLTSLTMCSSAVQVTPDRPPGHNSFPLRFVLEFGRAGTVKPSCVFVTKPATKVKDTFPKSLE